MTALLIAIPPAPGTVPGMERTLMRGWMGGSINWNMFVDVIYQLHHYSNYLEAPPNCALALCLLYYCSSYFLPGVCSFSWEKCMTGLLQVCELPCPGATSLSPRPPPAASGGCGPASAQGRTEVAMPLMNSDDAFFS